MKLLKLDGKYAVDGREFAKVDDDIYEMVCGTRWFVMYTNRQGRNPLYYVASKQNGKNVYLHRFVMGFADSAVDHINHDTLDNRRSNLRLATPSESQRNTRSYVGTSKFKGVYWDKQLRKWRSRIYVDGKYRHIGLFDKEEEAALAYDRKASIYHGDFSCLNFQQPYKDVT